MRILIALLFVALAGPSLGASIGNQTTLTYDPGHGTQVEFVAANGTNYLWYPGNRIVLPGHWKLDGANICWSYPENSYNPVTGQTGSNWECEPKSVYASTIVERAKGDVFGLAHRSAVPFKLSKTRTSIAALSKLIRGTAAGMPAVRSGAN